MSIQCPYCRFTMELKGAHAGRYKPKCAKCGKMFRLAISEQGEMKVRVMEEGAVASAGGTTAGATVAPAKVAQGSVSQATVAPAKVAPAKVEHHQEPERIDRSAFATAVKAEEAGEGPMLSGKLGGYRIERRLGGGGMGAVYLAKQLSLDRDVALKVMHPSLAKDPSFVARFTREAYAAAQLTHHNVVQIHDIGAEGEVHYFSMEFVGGQTLGEMVEKEGKLDADVAVGYALQAARGLKFAHDHGMIHRDIKPDNLLINDQGIVKVADLGLVKTPEGSERTVVAGEAAPQNPMVTAAQSFMGTPAYMAPEQARDSTKVDGRADIYSLGCTLYDMVTGRPPFGGKTAAEVMTKHQREAVVPPHQIVNRVPEQVSALLMKMVAKKPEERYANAGELISALEEYLGVDGTGPFSPKEEHARALEGAVVQFNSAWGSRLRSNLLLAIAGLGGLAWGGMLLAGWWGMAASLLVVGVIAGVSYFVVKGVAERSYLFSRAREWVMGAGLGLWIKLALVLVLGVLALMALGMLGVMAGLLILGVGLACAFYFSIDKLVSSQREGALTRTDDLLRKMRLRGLEEGALRQFVCRYAGDKWEEFYEALFGYESKMEARSKWGRGRRGEIRPKFGAWRDGIIRWIDARQQQRKVDRERRLLMKIEARRLEAAGMKEIESRKQAKRIADAMVQKAAEVRQGATVAPSAKETAAPTTKATAVPARGMFDEAIQSAQQPATGKEKKFEHHSYIDRKYGGLSGMILGAQTRFILGAALLLPFLLWLYQNRSVPVTDLAKQGMEQTNQGIDKLADPNGYNNPKPLPSVRFTAPTKALELTGVPTKYASILGTWNAGVAAVMLLISALFMGRKIGVVIIVAAALMVAGHLWRVIPQVSLIEKWGGGQGFLYATTLVMGLALGVLGFAFLREK
ncbi:MAG: serine/threonine protein kinase [Phycisphaerales bacterium]|nr:serine/threonine protein kinase [Phycisphaerales bacterium]